MSTRRFVLHGNEPFISNAKVYQGVFRISLIFSGSHWTVDDVDGSQA